MRIKKIVSQNRRDFYAIYECEHCGNTEEWPGYDDKNYHEKVTPKLACPKCKKVGGDKCRPLAPKYPEDMTI